MARQSSQLPLSFAVEDRAIAAILKVASRVVADITPLGMGMLRERLAELHQQSRSVSKFALLDDSRDDEPGESMAASDDPGAGTKVNDDFAS